ncbi:tetraspanin 35 [Triplophysa dalaica]|uniref:tetraspanin 35 n=1 Tax=Triplophysa dalaica TaxID=1582913 RepID=UPI0024E01DE5|nr:tetraspanin 35 [Triplophysa dalaica]
MGCFGFLKGMMVFFNGIIFLAGAAVLGVGIWVKVDSGSILNFLQNVEQAPSELGQLLNVGYLLIAVGAVLLILGFLGCCGAIRESRCMLLLFFVIILIVFIAEVAGAIVLLVFKPLAADLINQVGSKAVKSIKEDYGKNKDLTGLWNTTMSTLKCCGFYNFSDFTDSPFQMETDTYPPQCCSNTPCTFVNSNVTGCLPALMKLVDENTVVIIGVALGIAALELAAMIVSMTLYCKIGSKRD